MNIKQERDLLQQLLEEGKIDSLSIQVIALTIFANSIGYKAVDGDIRKGFMKKWVQNVPKDGRIISYKRVAFMSLQKMQVQYNSPFSKAFKTEDMIVNRISLQYNNPTNHPLQQENRHCNIYRHALRYPTGLHIPKHSNCQPRCKSNLHR